MDEWLARFLMVVETVGLVCITALAAYWMKLRHDRKTLGDRSAVAELERELAEFRQVTQGQIAELQERLDFSERLLVQRRELPVERPDHPTPV
jgi:hypothetical protein